MSKFKRHLSRHSVAGIIAILFLGLATLYSIVTPIFESPDELWHYPFVWHLARTGELPVQNPANPQLWQQEGSQPPLYYALAALLTASIPTDDLPDLIYRNPHADIGVVTPDGNANIVIHTAREAWPWHGAVLAIHFARLFSVVLGTGTVLSVYALGHILWPEQPRLGLVAMGFVAFNPMFIFIAGSVNNDNLITFFASLVVWLLVALVIEANERLSPQPFPFVRGSLSSLRVVQGRTGDETRTDSTPSQPTSPSGGGSQNLPPVATEGRIEGGPVAHQLLSWKWFIALGIVGGLAALSKLSGLGLVGLIGLTLLWQGWRHRSWRIGLLGNGLVGLLTLGIAGWWYVRNLRLYGDWSGTAPMIAMMGPRPVGPTLAQFLAEMPGLMRSFWGLFGYFSVALPSFIYWLLNGLFVLGLIGLLAALLFKHEALPPRLGHTWPILIGWLLILLTGFVRWTLRTPATQGRLLFPLLGVVAVLWGIGWLALAPRGRWFWATLPGLCLFLLAAWTPGGVIIPTYALPPLLTRMPVSTHPLDVAFAQNINLIGYESPSAIIRPGESIPITLYWQSDCPIDQDYTVFVHLIGEYELVIAQRNVFHGPGVYPTSQWTPGDILADTYILQVPNTAFAPDQVRFEVGLYDHTTSQRLLTSNGEDKARFGAIRLEPDPSNDLPNPQFLRFEDEITLVGYNVSQRQVAQSDTLTVTLYWQGQGQPSDDYKIFVHLVGENDYRAAQHDGDPQDGAALTSGWTKGQDVIDEHPLTIAADAPVGVYRLVVGLYNGETGQRLRLLQNGGASVQADAITLSSIRVVGSP